MRGFPPIQIFLLCFAFIGLAVPLSYLTGNSAQAKPVLAAVVKQGNSTSAWLRLRYAHAPSKLSVKVGDKELISSIEASPVEMKAALDSVIDGVDVFVTAAWPEGTPDTVLTLEIAPDGLESRSETRWSAGGSLDEVFTFVWK